MLLIDIDLNLNATSRYRFESLVDGVSSVRGVSF